MLIGEFQKIWRIILSVFILQFIGSIIGLIVQYHYSNFMNLWIGAAIATTIGVLVGSIWQWKKSKSIPKFPLGITSFTIIISIALFGIALFSEIPRLKKEMNTINYLRRISPKNIKNIIIYHIPEEKDILTLNLETENPAVFQSSEEKNEFSTACSDIEGEEFGSVSGKTFYIIINGKERVELIADVGFNKLVASIVKVSKKHISYHGHIKSQSLAFWIIANTKN